jgi:hypothetical protein
MAAEHHSKKTFTPHCCFGIFAPNLPVDKHINTFSKRAPFTSRKWMGIYWADGTSVPTLGILGYVTANGQYQAHALKGDTHIRIGDVLSIETRPVDDDAVDGTPGLVLFFVNGKEAARLQMSQHFPTCSGLEGCFFGALLSDGASIGTFEGPY